MLHRLLSRMDRSQHESVVVSLTELESVGKRIEALGIEVRALGMQPRAPSPKSVFQLTQLIRQERPEIVQTWMHHADLFGGLAAKFAGDFPVIWNIRQSDLDPRSSKRTTIWTAKACARLSRRLPTRIVCCSEASRITHSAIGYAADKMVVIPNGFDIDTFQPNREARRAVRRELGVPDDALLVGLVARFHPQKDHANFVRAAALLHERLPNVHFLLCGNQVSWENQELVAHVERAGIRDRCHLLGTRSDMPRIQASLDIATSSSSDGEGFSNITAEAMACGVPCVVTDVGDSALIVSDTGRVVPPRNSAALAEAWRDLIELGAAGRARLGAAAHDRIATHFPLPAIVARYEALYRDVARAKPLAG